PSTGWAAADLGRRVARNKGVVKAIEEEIGAALIVPSEPQIVGALGAALLAMEDLVATTR
ncbi:MAG: hypothetical protein WCD51_00070, partial [Anaerolineae bacterium]